MSKLLLNFISSCIENKINEFIFLFQFFFEFQPILFLLFLLFLQSSLFFSYLLFFLFSDLLLEQSLFLSFFSSFLATSSKHISNNLMETFSELVLKSTSLVKTLKRVHLEIIFRSLNLQHSMRLIMEFRIIFTILTKIIIITIHTLISVSFDWKYSTSITCYSSVLNC